MIEDTIAIGVARIDGFGDGEGFSDRGAEIRVGAGIDDDDAVNGALGAFPRPWTRG